MHILKLLTAVILAVLLASTATAISELDYGTHEISVTLQPGEDAAYLIPMGAGDRLTISLEVAAGGRADFYLTNITAYNAYKASTSGNAYFPSLYYVAEGSQENVSRIRYSYDSYSANEYIILLDNTGFTEDGATPTGVITITGNIQVERNIWTLQNIVILAVVIIAIILFMALLRLPKRRKKA
jgi:hypothetical protein